MPAVSAPGRSPSPLLREHLPLPLPWVRAISWLLLVSFSLIPGSSGELPKWCKVQYNRGPKRSQFPKGFIWGTATSAYQIEGATTTDGRGPSIWDVFVKRPGIIADGSTAAVSANSYHHYMQDVAAMREMGVQSYRFSISWSRIFPEGAGKVNLKGVAYYNRLINALLQNGIAPAVTLYHWDLPQALHNKYKGWLDKQSVVDFAKYAKVCYRFFGDRVKTWITFNEPQVVAILGYGTGAMAPGRCTACGRGNSATEPYVAAKNMLLAHAAAVRIYRRGYQKAQHGRIGITLESTFYYALNSQSAADRLAAQQGMEFNIGWFADAVVFGRYPKVMQQRVGSRLPPLTPRESASLRGSLDFLGVNCYTAQLASAPGGQVPTNQITPYTDRPAKTTIYNTQGRAVGYPSASPWLRVYPRAIYSMLKWYAARYPNIPLIVTENGVSQPGNLTKAQALCDAQRVAFFQDYLRFVLEAVREGVPVRAYYSWSLLDNFEWLAGFTQRFGIYHVDFSSPSQTRTAKASGLWWGRFLRNL